MIDGRCIADEIDSSSSPTSIDVSVAVMEAVSEAPSDGVAKEPRPDFALRAGSVIGMLFRCAGASPLTANCATSSSTTATSAGRDRPLPSVVAKSSETLKAFSEKSRESFLDA